MIIKYQGVEIDASPDAIKQYVEACDQELVGYPMDGEACLVHNYLSDQLHTHGIAPLIWVGNLGQINIGTGDDEVDLEADSDLLAVIQAFDMIIGDATPTRTLHELTKRGVW